MLVVVAVIAILAGVVLTGVTGFQASARDAKRIGDLRNIQNHLELYFGKCGHYPGISDARAECSGSVATWADLTTAIKTAGLTQQFPNDPVPGRNYSYGVQTTEGLQYVVGAQLERDNNVLRESIDGTTFGVACSRTSRFYCVQTQ